MRSGINGIDRSIYLRDGRLYAHGFDDSNSSHPVRLELDGYGLKIGCTRINEDAVWFIINFVTGKEPVDATSRS